MTPNMDGVRQLYEDAMYFHFLHQGYSEYRARYEAERMVKRRFALE